MTLFAPRKVRPAELALDIARLDRTSWRISDPTADSSGPYRILGFIERLARHRYEVLWLSEPTGWAYVATYDAAVAALADREGFVGAIRPRRDPDLVTPTPPLFNRTKRDAPSGVKRRG